MRHACSLLTCCSFQVFSLCCFVYTSTVDLMLMASAYPVVIFMHAGSQLPLPGPWQRGELHATTQQCKLSVSDKSLSCTVLQVRVRVCTLHERASFRVEMHRHVQIKVPWKWEFWHAHFICWSTLASVRWYIGRLAKVALAKLGTVHIRWGGDGFEAF
jgi:hypothetical protein